VAAEWDIAPSSAASRLLEEAIRINLEHQHGALIEAANKFFLIALNDLHPLAPA
jgi:hypothetical protein